MPEYNDLMWVSPCRDSEVEQVTSLLLDEAKKAGYSEYLPEDLTPIVLELIKQETVLCLRYETGTIVGVLIYTISSNPFMVFKKKLAQELVWCVKKPYRKYSKLLLKHYEYSAKEQGCEYTILSHLETGRFKLLGKVYKQAGYHKLETMYEKELI